MHVLGRYPRTRLPRCQPCRLFTKQETELCSTFTQVDRAFEVDAALDDLGIDLTEAEYSQLLAACVAGGAPWARAMGVLTRMGRELTTLQVLL